MGMGFGPGMGAVLLPRFWPQVLTAEAVVLPMDYNIPQHALSLSQSQSHSQDIERNGFARLNSPGPPKDDKTLPPEPSLFQYPSHFPNITPEKPDLADSISLLSARDI
jgi:hypothetical protein